MTASSHHIGDLLNRAPVIPVIVIDEEAVAVPLARALVAGGLTVLEVTLRTKCALASIKRIVAEVPDAVVGAGTILTQADVAASVEAGAEFLVSPGSTPGVLDAMLDSGAAPLPGAATASEVMVFIERGLGHGKFFPATTRRRDRLPQGARGTHPRLPLLSHRGHRPSRCPGLSRPTQCRLRRRLVDHPEGRRGRGRLGPDRDAGPRGCATRHNLSTLTMLLPQTRDSTVVDLNLDLVLDRRQWAGTECCSAGWPLARRGRPLDNPRRSRTT